MKKGIIVASFGTSFPNVRKKAIETIENKIKATYSNYEIRRAFTSNMIIKKLKERDNLHIHTPHEAIQAMINDGYECIHVQPLHVIHGFEYEKVQKAVKLAAHNKSVKVTMGLPLLSREEHYDEIIDILNHLTPTKDNHAYLLMGHGTEHHANASYAMLQMKFSDNRKDMFIANVEGYPELEHVIPKLRSYDKVTLMPLMIVAGDHAMNDMAGDEESFKSELEALGKEVTCVIKGLGELEAIEDIFVKRIQKSI
jgi:sirohydrochlorin cobaltochelatase